MTTTAIALLAAVIAALGGTAWAVSRRRRRSAALPFDHRPAGLKHLAAEVDTLSSFRMQLDLPGHGRARWRRIGSLIGVR